jgi:hypothetical protein
LSVNDWGGGVGDDWSNSVVWSVGPSVGVWESDLLGSFVVDESSDEELRGSEGNSQHHSEDNLQFRKNKGVKS